MKKTIIGGIAATATALGITLAAPAQADVFTMCPSGHAGVVGGHTSCAFAENVAQVFWASGSNEFVAYSPVTGEQYDMNCAGLYSARFTSGQVLTSTHCYGSDNAEVVIW
jgi:hypothetical protein